MILWGPVSQEILLKLYELSLWPNLRISTNSRMVKEGYYGNGIRRKIKIVYDKSNIRPRRKVTSEIGVRGQQECPIIPDLLQGCITTRSWTLDKERVKGGNKYLQKLLPPH